MPMKLKRLLFLLIIIGFSLGACAPGAGTNETSLSNQPDNQDSETDETGSDTESGDTGDSEELGSTDADIDTDADADADADAEEEEADPGCGDPSFAGSVANIGGGLTAGYEPSGADWHERLNKLFIVNDGGTVSMMNEDGTGITNWAVAGDLEGITVADSTSDFVYIGDEHPDAIKEFNISTGTVTRTFDLTPWMTGNSNLGLEALTFVADESHPEGGLFYAGHQQEGKIYVFDLPIKSSPTSTIVTYQTTLTPVVGRVDLAGLEYDPTQDIVYAMYDSANKLVAMTPDGTVLAEQDLPQTDQEGFTRSSSCDVFMAQDTAKKVWHYSPVQ